MFKCCYEKDIYHRRSYYYRVGYRRGYFYVGREVALEYEYTVAKRGDLVQEVSVTGKVKPAEAVDLAFEKSGKITRTTVKVGDKIKSGQILAELDNMEAKAQVAQVEASLESARAK